MVTAATATLSLLEGAGTSDAPQGATLHSMNTYVGRVEQGESHLDLLRARGSKAKERLAGPRPPARVRLQAQRASPARSRSA